MANWRIVAKSGEVAFSKSTFSACGAVSNPRGLIHSAAATTQEMVCGNTDTDGNGAAAIAAKCAWRHVLSSRCKCVRLPV
ncbi:hypothetical+protein [Methylocapsa aurea]